MMDKHLLNLVRSKSAGEIEKGKVPIKGGEVQQEGGGGGGVQKIKERSRIGL